MVGGHAAPAAAASLFVCAAWQDDVVEDERR